MTSPASPTLDTPSASSSDAGPTARPADLDEDWTTTVPKRGIRLRLPAIAAIVAAVALLGIGTGATLKGQSASSTAGTSAGATAGQGGAGRTGTGQGGPGGAGGFGRPTTGTVTKVDGNTIQLTDSNGAAVTVTVPTGATITANRPGAATDITVGSTIAVVGTTATDGTSTAQAVTINPTGIGAGGPGGPGAGTTPTAP
jgi:hypothetical protein